MYHFDIMLKDKGFFLVLHNSDGEVFNFKLDNINWIDDYKNNVELRLLQNSIAKSQSLSFPNNNVNSEDIFLAGLKFLDNSKKFMVINRRFGEEKNKQLKNDMFRMNRCKFTTRMFGGSFNSEILFNTAAFIINRYLQKGLDHNSLDCQSKEFMNEIGSVYRFFEFANCNEPEIADYICSDTDNYFFEDEKCDIEESEFSEFYNKYLYDKDLIVYMY